MTQPLYSVRSVPGLRPGQIVKTRWRAYALAAIDRKALDRAGVVLVGLEDPSQIEIRQITDEDLDEGLVEVFEGESVLCVVDGLPALGVDQDGREYPGHLSVKGGMVRWIGAGMQARIVHRDGLPWYAPALDLTVLVGEM